MKRITSTITTVNVTADFYNRETEEVERLTITKGGKFSGLDYQELPGYTTCKIINKSDEKTATYSMPLDKFMALAEVSENYHHGFINRKIGGEVANCTVVDRDTMQITTLQVENGTDKQIKKACEELNCVHVNTDSVVKINVQFYYMSYSDFALNGEIIERTTNTEK